MSNEYTVTSPNRGVTLGAVGESVATAATDADARTALDVPSTTEMSAAIGAAVGGLLYKVACRARSTTNVASLSGYPTIDGVTIGSGDANKRVLLTNQSTPSQNGPWVTAAGAWSRPSPTELQASAAFPISEGTLGHDQVWYITTNDPITAGVTSLALTQLALAIPSTQIDDASVTGRAVLTGDAAAGRTALDVYSVAQVTAAIAAAPSAASGLDAARPAASLAGRSYLATDTGALYGDTGSAWLVASNGGGPDRLTLAGFSGTAFLRGTSGPAGGKGTTVVLCFYLPTLPGSTQRFLWSCSNGSRGWGLALSGPGVTNNAIDYVLNNSGTLFDKQIGSALTTGWHTVAIAVASDGLTLAYSIDGAAATTGVSVASGSYQAAQAADNHTIGGWYGTITMGDTLEVGACVSIAAVASAAQLQALSADYASGRICTPSALTEDMGYRAALVPGYGTATGARVLTGGATRRQLTASAPLTVSVR